MMIHIKDTVFLFLAVASISIPGCGKDSALTGSDVPDLDSFESGTWYSSEPNLYASHVFEYTPAPGQFINDSQTGGMPSDMSSPAEAAIWAEQRLGKNLFVSLGGFGGYIIVGFDHEVINSRGDYDFAVIGNAFLDASGFGGSSEPGIVYVMEDSNSNGIPDDRWYELRGSEYGNQTTIHGYSVTYFRPSAPGQSAEWRDNLENTGTVKYLSAFHKQDYYYPSWITEDSYTLTGTRLDARTQCDPETGFWVNEPFPWGYADNMGEDCITLEGKYQANRFRIADAVDTEGNQINLRAISFVKIQSGIMAQAGPLGEVSTEVLGIYDLMTEPDNNSVPMIHI